MIIKLRGIGGEFLLPVHEILTSDNISFLFIAGGIGITPFLSMLDYISMSESKPKVTLLFSVRGKDELQLISKYINLSVGTAHPWLEIIMFDTATNKVNNSNSNTNHLFLLFSFNWIVS